MRSVTRVFVLAAIATLLCGVNAAEVTTSSLDLVSQSLNHVEVRAQWFGQSDTCHPLQWGDGSVVDLCGSEGDETKGHDYGYVPGGVETYEVSFLGKTLEIVIDDRPTEPSSCSLVIQSQTLNHVEIHVQWGGQDGSWHRLHWGDESWVDLCGTSGNEVKNHDYAYEPGGITTYKVNFLSCDLPITIDDRRRTYLPIIICQH